MQNKKKNICNPKIFHHSNKILSTKIVYSKKMKKNGRNEKRKDEPKKIHEEGEENR